MDHPNIDDIVFKGVSSTGQVLLVDTSASPEHLVKIAPSGAISTSQLPGICQWDRLIDDQLYCGVDTYTTPSASSIADMGIWRVAITEDAQPELVLAAQTIFESSTINADMNSWEAFIKAVDSATLWFGTNSDVCAIKLPTTNETAMCREVIYTFGGPGGVYNNHLYLGWENSMGNYYQTMNAAGEILNVYSPHNYDEYDYEYAVTGQGESAVMFDGWGYVLVHEEGPISSFPLHIAREPQVLFTENIITTPGINPIQWSWGRETGGGNVKIGSPGIVWPQYVTNTSGETIRTLIVSIPLPPRMCDAELPCTGEGESCGADGFCETD